MNRPARNSQSADAQRSGVADSRKISYGWGRIVYALFGVMSLVATAQIFLVLVKRHIPLGPSVLTMVIAVVYWISTIALIHNGRRMRMLGWGSLSVCLISPLLLGLMALGRTVPNYGTAWELFGANYFYVPLLLPVIGMGWMWLSNPSRIVEMAERSGRVS